MKCIGLEKFVFASKSPPTRAEWIEIRAFPHIKYGEESPPTRAEWIEIAHFLNNTAMPLESPPTRAEWIEITLCRLATALNVVSAHTGGVD